MSLFENECYQWRETYLILFPAERRPTAEEVRKVLARLGPQYEIRDVRTDEQGKFDCLTLISPDDYAAMDISFVAGDEVPEQTKEIIKNLKVTAADRAEAARLKRLVEMDARFDIYHFEEIVTGDEDEDEFMDPGCLLQVMQGLSELVDGIGLDPTAGALV